MPALLFLLAGWNAAIFLLLGLLHVYWAFGGKWGFASAIPTEESGKKIILPGTIASLIVAFGLLLFASITSSIIFPLVPSVIFTYKKILIYSIAALFGLRAIGEGNYVGFFRRARKTRFASMDKKFYSPLCLYLSISSAILGFFS
jgi:hypothetical protein